ncbi:hypothetical protein [Sphingomonas mesophila]|uniref:hypothetical protein n=1 Tax=Sphingomonas mesophila TaxID=2303576 RepID=UPI000E583EA6|nr:hypothetical protein [Sphingomonas mesophila]
MSLRAVLALLILSAAPAAAQPLAPVEASVRRSGDAFVAEFSFPRSAPAWAFFRSARAEVDQQPWRARSWTVLTPGVTLQRRGRYDAIVGVGGSPVPRRVQVRIVPFTRQLASDYVPALLLGGRGVALFDGHFAAFSVADPAALERFGVEPPEGVIGDGGTRVRFIGGRSLRIAGDVAGYRRGESSGAYGLFDVARAQVANGIATVIDSETPAWLAQYIARFTPTALGVLQARLGPSGIAEPTVLAAWEGAANDGASMNGGTLKGLILMRLEGKAALTPNPALREMARWFIAHEAAHFWLGQAVAYEGSRDSWIMEGGADLLAARTVQRLDPAYSPTPFLNQAIRDCAAALVKPVATAPERGEHRTTYACGTIFALAAERASGGDFYGFARTLIARHRSRGMVNSENWLDLLTVTAGRPGPARQVRAMLDGGAAEPKAAIATLLRASGVPFTLSADGLPTL